MLYACYTRVHSHPRNHEVVGSAIGRAWLTSSKIARKAGHHQTAYSAMLQARHWNTPYYFVQGCKLLHIGGDSIRALQELNNALSRDVIDLTSDESDEDMDVENCDLDGSYDFV